MLCVCVGGAHGRRQINEKYRLLPGKAFYSKEVSTHLNLESDYMNWISSSTTFSFCSYPFLLTPVWACRLGHVTRVHARPVDQPRGRWGRRVCPVGVAGGQSAHYASARGQADA